MGTVAFVYPGQGSQRIGMGRWFRRASVRASAIYEEAENILSYDLASLCALGPAGRLTSTEIAQPAIFVANAAATALLAERGIQPDIVAGHSVGEVSALWAAGTLDFVTGLRLVAERGQLMASAPTGGAMAAISGLPAAVVQAYCSTVSDDTNQGPGAASAAVIALHNGPEDIVVSGSEAAVQACTQMALRGGAKRVTPLVTSNAFHSRFMEPVLAAWAQVVHQVTLSPPQIPIAVNTTGAITTDVAALKAAMVGQLVQPVQWSACVDSIVTFGATLIVEAGDSRSLTGLNRRLGPSMDIVSLATPDGLRRLRLGTKEPERSRL